MHLQRENESPSLSSSVSREARRQQIVPGNNRVLAIWSHRTTWTEVSTRLKGEHKSREGVGEGKSEENYGRGRTDGWSQTTTSKPNEQLPTIEIRWECREEQV